MEVAREETTSAGPVSELPGYQVRRRSRILEAALAALEASDYETIQMRDVARGAGVALGTLYRYFSSKEHLYAAALLLWSERGRNRRQIAHCRSAGERVRKRMRLIIRAFDRSPQFYKVQTQLLSTSDPNAKVLMGEYASEAQQMLVDDFESLGAERARDVASMLWAVINSNLSAVVYHDKDVADAYRIADRFIDLVEADLDS